MNKENVLRYLRDYFSEIEVYEDLPAELIELIAGSGVEAHFFRILVMRIKMLLSMGVMATKHKEFESIGDGLYSMHLSGKGFNIRILYSFLQDRTPVLLLAFFEREGKNNTDYTPHIEPALTRLRQMREGI